MTVKEVLIFCGGFVAGMIDLILLALYTAYRGNKNV